MDRLTTYKLWLGNTIEDIHNLSGSRYQYPQGPNKNPKRKRNISTFLY